MSGDVSELIGIYDADSTLIGEIRYWIGARLGTRHCSLCEITHGLFTKKAEWTQCERSLAVPFRTYHRNDAPADAHEAADGAFPVVLARTGAGVSVVLAPQDIEAFGGSSAAFAEWLKQFLS
jgi:hypothetical protein